MLAQQCCAITLLAQRLLEDHSVNIILKFPHFQ